jgi:hypothetical protein
MGHPLPLLHRADARLRLRWTDEGARPYMVRAASKGGGKMPPRQPPGTAALRSEREAGA